MLALIPFAVAVSPVVAPQPPRTLASHSYLVGEGWGCALVVADRKSAWQCWEAGGNDPEVQAWPVPWMERRSMVAGPDRLCTIEDEQVRCFHPPRRGETAPRPWGPPPPPRPPKRDAGSVDSNRHSFYDDSALYEGLVGGTFACPSKENDIWCAGDNTFGQLGYWKATERPPLLKLWITENVGLGFWHACAWRGGGPPQDQGLFCWGRGDAGQLGLSPPDVCKVDGKVIGCARRPTRVPVPFRLPGRGYAPNRGRGDLRGGDLFTCARPARNQTPEIVCWGASRDGLFGEASLCPPGLGKAWPTRRGSTIEAPGATCSPTPAPIAGSGRFKRDMAPLFGGKPSAPPEITDNFDIGPRGICIVSDRSEIWCKGAIRTPRKLTAETLAVSPGDNASACARTKEGRLYCWGEGYSPADASDRAVAIAFEPPPPPPANPNPAPVDAPARGKPWGKSCSIHGPCERVARTIAPCPPRDADAITADAAEALPADGRSVSVRGPLRLGPSFQTLAGCSENDPETGKPLPVHACCNNRGGPIIVGDGRGIVLEGFRCAGDESRICCDLLVSGQAVVASGKLVPYEGSFGTYPKYKLKDAKICGTD